MRVTNEMLEELYLLEKDVRIKTVRINEIKSFCRERGSFATRDYVCAVQEVTRETLGPLAAAIRTFGREALDAASLIHQSKYVTVRTTRKEKPAEKDDIIL